MSRPTLDTRHFLLGEKRLSNPQVELLRKCSVSANGTAEFDRPGTAGVLVQRGLARWTLGWARRVTITSHGLAVLSAIDVSTHPRTTTGA